MHTGRRLGLTAPRCVWVAEKHTLKVRSRLGTGVEGPAGALCHHHDVYDFVPHLVHDAVEQRTELRPPFARAARMKSILPSVQHRCAQQTYLVLRFEAAARGDGFSG